MFSSVERVVADADILSSEVYAGVVPDVVCDSVEISAGHTVAARYRGVLGYLIALCIEFRVRDGCGTAFPEFLPRRFVKR